MNSLFPEFDLEEACFALRAGREQEGITRIYTILRQRLQGSKRDIGLYPTPISLARFMVEIADPRQGETIYDPACGLGSFFVESYRHLKERCGRDISDTFLGYDINSDLLRCGKAWMETRGIDTSCIREHDLIKQSPWNNHSDKFEGKYVILTHPPYEQIADRYEESSPKQFNGSIGYYDREYVRHCMATLRKYPDGRCGIVVPQDFFYNSSTNGRIQRRELVNEFNLQLLIRLPEKMFTSVNYYSYLLYFDKYGTTSQILCCDIREDEAPVLSRTPQSSDGVSFKETEDIWKRWREQSSEEPFSLTEEERKFARVLDADTIREQDPEYRLINYVPPRIEEKPALSLDKLMQRLVEQTGELHELAQQLQKRIKEGV